MNPHLFFPSLQSVYAGILEPLFPKHELTVISSKQNTVLVSLLELERVIIDTW